MMRSTPVQKELVSIAVGLIALGFAAAAFASEVITVVQRDRNFQTKTIDIAVGDVVHFANEDPYVHQLYTRSDRFNFSSEEQKQGNVLAVPFNVAGSYEVRCEIHPKMLLKVEVH
jgi:plastocyanin